MARSLAQTKHLDTTDCLAWRLCFGNCNQSRRPLAPRLGRLLRVWPTMMRWTSSELRAP